MERIEKAIDKLLVFVKGIPLDSVTVEYYQRRCRDIQIYCENGGIDEFDGKAADLFINEQKARHDAGEFAANLFRQLRKTASLLAIIVQGEQLVWERKIYGKNICENYERVFYPHIRTP